MKILSHAVPHQISYYRKSVFLDMLLNGMRNIMNPVALDSLFDSLIERLFRDPQELLFDTLVAVRRTRAEAKAPADTTDDSVDIQAS